MCGICGFTSINPWGSRGQHILRAMSGFIGHRGPDDEGYYLGENIGLSSRRLSIVDLVTGHQPISNEDESLWLVANAEIYNYRMLRRHLERGGHLFRTRTDVEVIIHAFEEFGDACVDHFNGMFAFAIWDERRRRLLLSRDRLGIKPLYYWSGEGSLVFGSEAKAVVAHPDVPPDIDAVALDHFLTLEYTPNDRSIFKDVYKLPPGHQLVVEDGNPHLHQYWDIPVLATPGDKNECTDAVVGLLRDAVRLRLMSDVPVGASLSGGVDSSAIVSLMSEFVDGPIPTFSIGFEDATYDELPYARAMARYLGTDHSEETVRSDLADLVEQLVSQLDEPLADFSIVPTYLLCRLASRSVKVMLCGDGGDELFAGYDTYVAQHADHLYHHLPQRLRRRVLPALARRIPPQPGKKGLINKTKRFVDGASLAPSLRPTRWMVFLSEGEKSALYNPALRATLKSTDPTSIIESYFKRASGRPLLAQQQYVDIKTYLVDDILTKVDRMSMAASIEARVPMLDHRIVELAVNLPSHMKLRLGQTKVLLRRAMTDRLPKSVLRKPKQGFSMPVKHWLRGPLRLLMTDTLSAATMGWGEYFRTECIELWISEHLSGRVDHSHRLWALMVFGLWRDSLSSL